MIENACIVEIANGSGPLVGFNNIINGTGFPISTGVGGKGYARQALICYNNKNSVVLDDYYAHGNNESGIIKEQTGIDVTDDPKAEDDIDVSEYSCSTSCRYLVGRVYEGMERRYLTCKKFPGSS